MMGAEHSKQTTRSGKRSPNQDKHTSADSHTPLTQQAIDLTSSCPSPQDRRRWTIAATELLADERAREIYPVRSVSNSIQRKPTPQNTLSIDDLDGHSNVSRPPQPPRIRRLSELVDPAEVPIDAHIRSPSGNLLAPEQFLFHPDRPLSIRERQDDVREKVRAASRLGMAENARLDSVNGSAASGKRRRRGLCGSSCFR